MGTERRASPDEIVAALVARIPGPGDAPAVSRWMLGALSLPHAPVYKARQVLDRLGALGLVDPMAAYLAERSAPMGRVEAAVVTSSFFGFSPRLVATHVPAVWEVATPEQVVATTLAGMREFGDTVLATDGHAHAHDQDVARASELLRPIAEAHEVAGRPLAAAWASVPWTGEDWLDLWIAVTRIRESRGDGHVAALVSEGVGPLASHLLSTGDGAQQRAGLALLRGWSEDEVADEASRLHAQGLLEVDGRRTDAARRLREHIEAITDRCSSRAWSDAGPQVVREVTERMVALALPLLASGAIMGAVLARLAPRR
jgi:hypothetical protein